MDIIELKGENISLKRLQESDATQEYVNWLNDIEVNQYLESRFFKHTVESAREFIVSVSNSKNYAFAIIDNNSGKHIGNIKIGCIDWNHGFADVGFLIGDKKFWGKGIATEAVKMGVDFSFKTLKLHRIMGGAYVSNIGSCKIFEKLGFKREGIEREKCSIGDKREDVVIYAIINENK